MARRVVGARTTLAQILSGWWVSRPNPDAPLGWVWRPTRAAPAEDASRAVPPRTSTAWALWPSGAAITDPSLWLLDGEGDSWSPAMLAASGLPAPEPLHVKLDSVELVSEDQVKTAPPPSASPQAGSDNQPVDQESRSDDDVPAGSSEAPATTLVAVLDRSIIEWLQ